MGATISIFNNLIPFEVEKTKLLILKWKNYFILLKSLWNLLRRWIYDFFLTCFSSWFWGIENWSFWFSHFFEVSHAQDINNFYIPNGHVINSCFKVLHAFEIDSSFGVSLWWNYVHEVSWSNYEHEGWWIIITFSQTCPKGYC